MGKRWNRLATALLATITVCSTAIGGLTSESRVEAEGVTPVRGTVSNYYVVPNFVYFNNGDMDNQHKMSYHVPDNAPIISPDVSRDTQSLEWAVTFNQNGESWIDGKFFIGLPSEVADPESISIDHNGNTTDFDISNNWNQNKGVIEIADRSEIEKIFTLDKFNNTKSDDNGVDVDDNEMQGRLSLNYDFLKSENLRKVFWFKPEDNKPYVLRFKTRLNTQLSNQRIPVYAGTSDRSGNQANQRVTREKVQAIGLYDTIYCYNHDWVPPKDKTKADYQYLYKGRSNYFDSIAADPMLEDKDILGYVLYLGYPNNESFDGFNLLDTAYTKYPGNGIYSFAQIAQGATQVAVWHLSDEMELDEGKDIHQLAKILIEKAKEMKKAEGPFLDFVKKYNKQAYVYYYDNNNETEIATNTLFQNFVTLKADGPEEIPIDFKVNKIATDGQKLAGARFDIYDGIYPTMDDLSGKTAMLANVSEQQLLSEIKSHHPYTIVETQSPEGYAASKDPVVFQIERMYDLHTVQSNNAKDPTEEPEHFVDTKTNKFRLSILRNIEDTWKWMPEKEIQEVDSQEKLAFELPFVNEAKPFIRTTVQVAGKESTKEKAVEVAYSESQVSVKDKIAYRTLQPNTEYVVFGRLMKVVGEEVNLVKSSVRTFTTGQDLKEASGEIVLDFGDVSLEKDAAYVVYEQVGPKSEAKVSNENNVFQPVLETSDISYPGYTATFDNEENVVKHEDSKDLSQTFVVSSVQTKEVVFSKQDIAGKEIEGAQIELKQGDEVVASWTSKADESHKVKLVAGTYTFHEEAAPNGYLAVTDFTFTVKADGTVELGKTSDAEIKDGKLVVTDQLDKKEVVFSKQDIAGKEIEGAQIELKQGEEVVASWTSKADESHKVKLVPGAYTFHEEAAPNGYLAVTDFTFTVKADGTVELGKTSDAEIKDGKLVVTDQLDKKEVVFSKQDIAGKEIAGAQIELKQGEEVVASWTSKADESHKVKLVAGTYTFHEEAAPNGYLAVTDFTFTVKADGTVELGETSDAKIEDGKLVVTGQLDKKEVVFSKQDIAGKEIEGAQIELKQGEEVVASWTSKADESHKVKLVPGTYTFHEEAAPNGYLAVTDFTFTVKADGTVELGETSDAKVKDGKLVVTDQAEKKTVTFSKQDIVGKEIAGAQIQIKQGEEVVEKWTSKEGQSHQINLAPGSYTFHEEAAPNGYLAVTDFTFTVKADGTVELGETSDAKVKDGKLVVTDQAEKKTVTFSKQDIAGKEIEGAQIELKQGEEVVASWTSKAGESHKVKLAPGTYTFHEEAAPNGYLAVTDFTFTVKADGKVELGKTSDAKIEDGKLVVTDQLDKKEVVFSKQDIAGKEIEGAQIELKQGKEVVASWTSKADESHKVKLVPGTYTFHEEAAPNGYLAVTDFTFTVKADGTVELGKTSDAEIKDGKLVVTDQKKPEVPTVTTKKVVFSKQNVAGDEIAGAKIQIKQGDKVVESWTSEAGKSHTVKLEPGEYTFHEEAAPNGYLAVTDFTFTVKADGTVELGKTSDAGIKEGKLVVTDQKKPEVPTVTTKKVVFSKQNVAGDEIVGAKIQIKQGDKVVESWTSEAGKSHTVELEPGTYTFHEEAAPNGYLSVTDFTFTVKADGTVELGKTSDAEIKEGKLVVTDQKKPEVPTVTTKKVVFSKQNVAGDEIAGAKIQIKQGDKVVESWTSEAGKSHTVKLEPGEYIFHEEAAPNGYLAVTDFTFTVKADGKVELGKTSDAKIEDGKLVVTDQLDKKEVVFSKQDIAGKEIEGAQIELKQGEEVVASWTSKADESHKVKLVPGTYTFHEEAAPNGYLAVTDFTFTVKADGTVELGKTSDAKIEDGKLVVTGQLEKKEVVFSKQNVAGEEIAGAKIQIKQGDKVVESWTSEAGKSHTVKLEPGEYTFHEEAAPNGYLAVTDFTFTVKADGTVELGKTSDAKIEDGKLVVTDQLEKKEVVFSKQNVAGDEIAGAKIQIKQGDKVVESWTSEAGKSHTVKLEPGEYIFHEEAAPNGYLAVTDFTFTVKADGKVELGKTSDAKIKDGKLVVTDQLDKKEVVFSKQDIAGKEIEGAQIELKQGEEVVASWTSKADESHKVKLVPGTYTFHEEAAPNGYLAVTDFTFTVKADGTVELGKTSDAKIKDGKLVVTDQLDKKEVVFSKQDIAGKEIEGAQIELKQGEEVVASWTSKADESHKVKLVLGTYTFHEEAAPNGYLAVTDFTFTVKADGTVELGETSDAEIKDGKLVVTDQKKPEVPTVTTKKVVFSKQNVAGEEIAGAKIQIKQGDKVVESWTSEAGKSRTVKLEPGEYTFHEEAAPNGYLAVTDFTFTVKADGTVELGETSDAKIKDGKLVVTDQKKPEVPTVTTKKVVFSKQNVAGEEIAGAKIQIKQGDKVVESWTSEAGKSHTVKLEPGEYTFHEETAPNGYLAVTDFTFTVKANGTVELGETSDAEIKDGKLVVTDQLDKKEVVFSKQDIAGKEIAGAQIELKQGEEVVASWTSKAGESHKVKLAPGTYTFHEEAAPNGYLAVTDFTFTVKADGTVEVSATPDAKVENGKLVVTDQKEPDTPNYVNPKEGNLRTTVSANDLTANETHAVNLPSALSKQVKVVDTIYYTDLVAGESYQLTGALMKITANGQAQAIATQTAKVVADATGTGTWSLNFGTLALEPGTKYVIFETATSEKPLVDTNKDNQPDAPHVVEHKNPNDLAKTIVVAKEVPTPTPTPVEKGNLRTTVSAANQNGSATKPATITAEQAKKVAVKDTVMYEKLVANQAYQLVGTLMHVKDGKVTPIATQSKDVIADQTGNGQWVLDFGTLTLQSGETYVVYEVATSKEKLVDTNNDGEMDDSQVVEHKNPNDLSQTIVVENEKPTEPTKPQPKEIIFSKQNVDGEEIAGAQIQIKQNGKVISEWTSKEGQSHVIKLLPGTYTFHEEAAPNGYLKVTDFEFTISEDGKVSLTGKGSDVSMVNGKLVIVDQRKEIIPPTPTPEPTPEPTPTEPQPKEITFSKQNVDGEEIASAKIQIKQNGKVISEWTSEKGQSHVIKLLPGTYTFHEEAAPNGYLKVTDFEFTIDENGKVTVKEGQKDAKIVDGKLVVIDQRKEKTPKDELKKEQKQELPKSGTQAIHPMAGLAMILIGLSVFGVNIRFRKK